jgi:hypothetical protein
MESKKVNPKDNPKARRGFGYWFKNVFIYHYLKPTILGAIVLLIAAYIIYDIKNVVIPDLTVVVGGIDILREEDMSEIKAVIEDEIGDANGDGTVVVNFDIYTVTLDKADEYGKQNLEALDLSILADPDRIFFILDEELTSRYEADFFEKLADYDISTDEDPFYRVNDLPIFQRMLVVDTNYYMCLKGMRISDKDDPEYVQKYDLAARVMKRLINEE